jgi:hypothetical protein
MRTALAALVLLFVCQPLAARPEPRVESMKRYWTPYVDEGGGESFCGYGWVVTEQGGMRIITHNGATGFTSPTCSSLPIRVR